MTIIRLTRNNNLAILTERVLTDLLIDGMTYADITDEDDYAIDVDTIETYAEAGLLTRDKGLVVKLTDGSELHLTITAYGPQH